MAGAKKKTGVAKKRTRTMRKAAPKAKTRTRTVTKTVTKRVKPKALKAQQLVVQGLTGVVGAIAAGAVASRVPVKDPKLKAALPMALGAALVAAKQTRKNPMVRNAAIGAIVAGGLATAKQLAPDLPLLAGEDSYMDELDYFPTGQELGVPMMGQESLLGAPMMGSDGYNY
jgi:hypothetical protein